MVLPNKSYKCFSFAFVLSPLGLLGELVLDYALPNRGVVLGVLHGLLGMFFVLVPGKVILIHRCF